jgi:benzoate/toluate 1,2-dioxygenase subunit alpha
MTATMLQRSPDLWSQRQEGKKSMLDTIQETLDTAVEDDPANGVYRVSRNVFTDPQIFELEMKHIFEGNWIYLAHESQIPNKNDYFTTYIGRQPIFIARDSNGELNAFINACSHRGAILCRFKRGNKSTYTCPFHGWTFSNSGNLLKVKDPDGAGYPERFNKEGSHDLTKVARFESYRGFLFGSLNPNVPRLVAHLGEATKIIDLVVDQSPEGLEVLRGSSTYVYDGNWKLQTENGADGYHVTTVHWNYVATTERRKQAARPDNIRAMSASGFGKHGGGFHSFENGHLLAWANWANPEDRPNWGRREELKAQFGEARADWMVRRLRTLCLYPNVYLMDQFSSQIRQYRPIAVDKTEVTIYCIAPKGESAEARARRIRQYEDFFNASGMATPDDLEEFRGCQMSYRGRAARWNDLSRGAEHWIRGPDAVAEAIGLNPLMSGARVEDEGLFLVQHKYWQEAMRRAFSAETKLDARGQAHVDNA